MFPKGMFLAVIMAALVGCSDKPDNTESSSGADSSDDGGLSTSGVSSSGAGGMGGTGGSGGEGGGFDWPVIPGTPDDPFKPDGGSDESP